MESLSAEKEKIKFTTKQIESCKKDEECLRVSFTTEEEALKWLELYQISSRTHWIVDQTFPHAQRYCYKNTWKCNLSSKNKTSDGVRNQECPATLAIKIKFVTRDTKKKDPLLGKHDPPLPGFVFIKTNHNHHLNTSDSMQYLRGDKALRQYFEDYFDDGIRPDAAMRLHEEKLRLEDNGEELIADGHYNPLPNTVYWWHKEWRKKNFGSPLDPLETLIEKSKHYEAQGSTVVVDKVSPWCVLVVTPLMRRAHQVSAAEEIIFVDTTSTVDASHSNATVVSTGTKIGAVPLVMLFHEDQSTEGYKRAFKLFQANFPTAFNGKTHPEVFMTDNSPAEKSALMQVWPQSAQLLCRFHVVQQEWTWLLSAKHNVEQSERQGFMREFQKILYARTAEELEESITSFNETVTHEGYKQRVEGFLKRKEEWVTMFRDNTLMRNHHTNNYSEATIRILKDVILERVKAYNLVALTNYIITVWENYMKTRILRVAYNRDSKPVLVYENLRRKMDIALAKRIKRIDEDIYMVPSATNSDLMYEVHTNVGVCNCKAGCTGAFCKHQALLHSVVGGCFPNAPPIMSQDRHQLGLLALGEKCPPATFFLGMKEGLKGGPPLSLTSGSSWLSQEVEIQDGGNVAEETPPSEAVELPGQEGPSVSPEEKEKIWREFEEEWRRLRDLAKDDITFLEYCQKATNQMQKIRSGSGATGGIVNVVNALKGYSSSSARLGAIKVQRASIIRRPADAPRTSKRLPAGRKPGKKKNKGANTTSEENLHKTAKRVKRKRQIAQSIQNNIAHVKK